MLRAINKPDSPLRRAAAAMPLLAWVALGTFVLALAAAAASSTGRYVADARFEIYWGTGRYLRSQLSLWDGVRNLGRPNPYFSPVVGVFVGALRLIGLSPAWAERVLHAAMISLGATGAAAVMAQRRPKDRTAVVLTALVFGFNPIVAEFLVPSGIFFHYALAPWLVWCVQGAVAAPGRTAPWKWPARTALVIFAMGAINSASLLYAFGPAVVVAAGLVLVEARGRPDRHARLRSLWGYAAGRRARSGQRRRRPRRVGGERSGGAGQPERHRTAPDGERTQQLGRIAAGPGLLADVLRWRRHHPPPPVTVRHQPVRSCAEPAPPTRGADHAGADQVAPRPHLRLVVGPRHGGHGWAVPGRR